MEYPQPPIRGAMHVDFDPRNRELLMGQWKSPSVSWALRAVILFAAAIFHEQGAHTLRVKRLLGNDEFEQTEVTPFSRGLAAEISLWEFGHMRGNKLTGPNEDLIVSWVARRLNQLFYYGPGRKEVAQYGETFGIFDRLVLEVPATGLDPASLCNWQQFGNTGKILPARKKILVNEE